MVASFIALIVGIWGAVKFSGMVGEWLVYTMNVSSPYIKLVSFTITFIAIAIGINIVAYLISRFLDIIALGLFNRMLGIVFGVFKMALILSVIFLILNAFNERHEFMPEEEVEKSLLYKPVANLAPEIFPFLRLENISQELRRYI